MFSCAQALAHAKPQTDVVAALMGEPDEDPNDLAALDAAWEEEEVTFGPGAAAAGSAARTASPPSCARPSARARHAGAGAQASRRHLHAVQPRLRRHAMRDVINHIVFGWYPYLCLTVFLLGSLLRFDREQYTWQTGSSQLLRRRQLMWGSNLFHVGILVIFFGHFVGLLTPIWVFDCPRHLATASSS